MFRERLPRLGLAVGLVAVLLTLLASPVSARSAIILETSKPAGDPGLIDVVLQDVVYDASIGTIAVTATVQCFSDDATLVVVDFEATQQRGPTTRSVQTFNDDLVCNESFTEVLSTEGGFVPGPATIEISGFACTFNCALEILRAAVVLLP
jgi:hypothetical protein